MAPIAQFNEKSKSLKFVEFTKIAKKKALDIKAQKDSDSKNEILQQIFDAIESNDLEALKMTLSSKGADVNTKDTNDATALIRATWSHRTAIVKFLLTQDHIDVNAQDKDGSTALHLASSSGCIEIVRELLSVKAIEVDKKAKDGTTPLIAAAENQLNQTVKLLLEHKANVNAQDEEGGTPLLCAIRNANADTVQILLKHDADVNISDKLGRSPLMWGLHKKNPTIVNLLLANKKININAKNIKGETALDIAKNFAVEALEKILVERGAIHGEKTKISAKQEGNIFPQDTAEPNDIPQESKEAQAEPIDPDPYPQGIQSIGVVSFAY
jgi:ankyrin repeat protein